MNFSSLFKAHLKGHLLCEGFLNLSVSDFFLSALTVTSSWLFREVAFCSTNLYDLYSLAQPRLGKEKAPGSMNEKMNFLPLAPGSLFSMGLLFGP